MLSLNPQRGCTMQLFADFANAFKIKAGCRLDGDTIAEACAAAKTRLDAHLCDTARA